ncbi:hypothetical protein [Pelomonas cellulosilytica]|uniref:Piwi domain-containing protein n=1 Tax=Pelomonas cellulosilytica TaxID=2906762 RepID=A0ABS8XY47_9BURK|nr:hypothetical protein [Pelomonas sp. P8]MCE4554250.1 hypothetical protein [Pelomonas sp. P8]
MSDSFHYIGEPLLEFGDGQTAEDPHDGLALFGPAEKRTQMPDYVVIGSERGLALWRSWCEALNSPASCVDVLKHRAWPPYPGYEVAFGARWRSPIRELSVDAAELSTASRKADRHERAYAVANLYLAPLERIAKLDSRPALAVCVVPDEVYENCRPKSFVPMSKRSDADRPKEDIGMVKAMLKSRSIGQAGLFDFTDEAQALMSEVDDLQAALGHSPDFRRQLKARMMAHELPVQIIKESTLAITSQVRMGEKGTNPLSDRLWNFGTAAYYKCGAKPWKTPWAREGVCYVGIAYKLTEDGRQACCAAQMFLDSGDGLVFVGEFGPWYSRERGEFHLPPEKAEALLRGVIATYQEQDGRPLKEVFIHARSGIDADEFAGFQRACPEGVSLVAIRVRMDHRGGMRLYRFDDHPDVSKRGQHPVQRGVFWQRSRRFGLLFTNGFKSRLGTYDGFEVPVPLTITIQHGEADLLQVARDVLGLTKLNYNACQLGEGQPITVKYSERVGEILLANPGLPPNKWKPNFKYYA